MNSKNKISLGMNRRVRLGIGRYISTGRKHKKLKFCGRIKVDH